MWFFISCLSYRSHWQIASFLQDPIRWHTSMFHKASHQLCADTCTFQAKSLHLIFWSNNCCKICQGLKLTLTPFCTVQQSHSLILQQRRHSDCSDGLAQLASDCGKKKILLWDTVRGKRVRARAISQAHCFKWDQCQRLELLMLWPCWYFVWKDLGPKISSIPCHWLAQLASDCREKHDSFVRHSARKMCLCKVNIGETLLTVGSAVAAWVLDALTKLVFCLERSWAQDVIDTVPLTYPSSEWL